MMNKKEITQFAKKIIHSQKGLKNSQLMHPKREWLTGVAVAMGIFAASITWSALEYFEYQTIEEQAVSQSSSGAAAAVYRETLVTEALSVYVEKSKRLNKLTTERVPVTPDENVEGEEMSPEEAGSESSEDSGEATTTDTTASSSDIQVTTDKEESTEPPVPPENPTPSRSQMAPEPAVNI